MRHETEVRGDEGLDAWLMSERSRAEVNLREIINDAADVALDAMRLGVPVDQGEILRSLDREEIAYAPGGAGGGGSYQVRVGPIERPPSHLEFVIRGTGVHGEGGMAYGSFRGKAMPIRYGGLLHGFATTVRGQRPQTDWYTDAFAAAQAYIDERIQRFDT